MIGWHISVYRQADGGGAPATNDSVKGQRLAVWQGGWDGLAWLGDLVRNGDAVELGGGGYPCSFTAQAEHLIPQIICGPPDANRYWGTDEDSTVGPKWEGRTVIHPAVIADCTLHEWLLVVAWDES